VKRGAFLFFILGFLIIVLASSALSLPLPPSHLEAQIISPTHIRLTWWDNSVDEDGFIVERRAYGEAWKQIAIVPPDVNVYNDEGLVPGRSYYYRVRAYMGSYYTDYCELSSPVTTIGYPEPPSNLKGRALSSSEIELEWTDESDNELGFIVERKLGNNWLEIAVLPPNSNSYIDEGLSENTKYTYRVLAFNDAGRTSSSEVEVKTGSKEGEIYLSAGCSVGNGSLTLLLMLPPLILLCSLIRRKANA